MTDRPTKQAVFKAIVLADGHFVAGIAAIPADDRARFFVCEKAESAEAFIGRVSAWVKAQGGAGVEMAPPDVVEEGTEVGELLMRLRLALGAPKNDDSSEFDVAQAKIQWTAAAEQKSS